MTQRDTKTSLSRVKNQQLNALLRAHEDKNLTDDELISEMRKLGFNSEEIDNAVKIVRRW